MLHYVILFPITMGQNFWVENPTYVWEFHHLQDNKLIRESEQLELKQRKEYMARFKWVLTRQTILLQLTESLED